MIKLIIDGAECDVRTSSTITLSYDHKSLTSLDDMSEGESVSVLIPSTPTNDEILAEDGYLHSPERFNSTEHTAEVWYKGERLVMGSATLAGVAIEDGQMWYTIGISVQRAIWASNSKQGVFNEFGVELDMKLAINRIQEQWESDDPVRFVVVWRDTYTPVQSSVSTEMVREVASLEDYHPFLHVETMLRSIFEGSGYTVISEFLKSEEATSLYMSGSYGSSTNSTETRNAMDFYVKRSAAATATANSLGRVYMTPSYTANSIGAIVDADTINSQSDCFSYGGCFAEVDGYPTFTPLTQVYVGFAVTLKYITPYYIESRETLKAFNKVYLCSGHDYEFNIANNFEDQRDMLYPSFSYMLCLFDYSGQALYLYFKLANGSYHYHSKITSRVTYFTSYSAEIDYALLMYVDMSEYESDWAIYGGYVQESGETEVEVTLRITPELRYPSSPFVFNNLFIYGAESGWEITIKEDTHITPYFAKHPGCNSYISFADIAQVDAYQSSLVESIAHMYNLRIFTDEVNKVVYIEPYDDMWDYSTLWDWSEKIDPDKAIEISDLAAEVYQTRKWGYRDGDGVTSRGDGDIPADDEFGFWQGEVTSCIAKEGTESLLSPLYSPSQSTDEGILQVGDRDDVDNVNTFDFTSRIVRYKGDVSYDGYMMPRMSFYCPDEGVSLCFEDRGGVEGLNRYYTNQIAIEQRGRILSLWLKLTPYDVSYLFSKNGSTPSVLSLFSFEVGGEKVKSLLKEIVEYDPTKDSTLCRFIVVD